MPNKVTFTITCCEKCRNFVEEDIDNYHGSNYTPPYCRKAKKYLDHKKVDSEIPDWCPLLKKKQNVS